MIIPKHILTIILSLSMLVDGNELSLRVDRAVAPTHPVTTVAAGVVIIQVDLDRSGKLVTRLQRGDSSFVASAWNAIGHWTFAIPRDAEAASTSISFLYRAPKMPPHPPFIMPPLKSIGADRPALPIEITDLGHSMMAATEGCVIFELNVDSAGKVTKASALLATLGLTEPAQEAVMHWKFTPALVAGKPSPSLAFAVISFVMP